MPIIEIPTEEESDLPIVKNADKWLKKLGKLGEDGHYIGVTATPGRLDLNNTFKNNINNKIQNNSPKLHQI